jgi:hypothetical protein
MGAAASTVVAAVVVAFMRPREAFTRREAVGFTRANFMAANSTARRASMPGEALPAVDGTAACQRAVLTFRA